MSRKKIYKTEKEKHEAQRRWQREHYYRNRDKILNKAKKKYQLIKQIKLENEKQKHKSYKEKNIYGE